MSCRMKETDGVEMVQMVYVGRPLMVGSDSLLLPVWRSVGDGFTGKGRQICGYSGRLFTAKFRNAR